MTLEETIAQLRAEQLDKSYRHTDLARRESQQELMEKLVGVLARLFEPGTMERDAA